MRRLYSKLEDMVRRYVARPLAIAGLIGVLSYEGNGYAQVLPKTTQPILDCNENGVSDKQDILPTLRFETSASYGISYPRSIASGDFDNDGDIDLATANLSPGNVSVLFNDGNGNFDLPISYSFGNDVYPKAIKTIDIENDGDLDLALAVSWPGNLFILSNSGDGIFDLREYSANAFPDTLDVNDFNNDGYTDLVTANFISENFSVFLNDGNGNLTLTHYSAGGRPESVTSIDINNDGYLDLAMPIDESSINYFLNKRNGRFDPPFPHPTGFGRGGDHSSERSIIAVDLDQDRYMDLAVANVRGLVSILFNKGDSTFMEEINYQVTPGEISVSIASGDFDNNGYRDLAVSVYHSRFGVLQNINGKEFIPIPFDYGEYHLTSVVGAYINNDKNLDLVVAEETPSRVSVLLNQSLPPLSLDHNRNSIPDECESFIRGDANRDRKYDISDPVKTLRYLFNENLELKCLDAIDSNDDGRLDISDPIYSFSYLFLNGQQPPEPFPSLGIDPTNDNLDCKEY